MYKSGPKRRRAIRSKRGELTVTRDTPTSRQRLKHAWSLAHRLRTEPTFSTSEVFWRRIETSCGCYDPRAQEGRGFIE
ncbi:BQ5605_C001g00422 [Microbotryum silenes-dioicae]|uniref:BQ5605_C001g00422 protein n=1 Tax=Microbotryum silenes-dioicae TaxID=796604 RepID=A0A2X0MQP4_9BASI|nr:BQ5605_C001g00422 [Microbotryum silenes-dioicae]